MELGWKLKRPAYYAAFAFFLLTLAVSTRAQGNMTITFKSSRSIRHLAGVVTYTDGTVIPGAVVRLRPRLQPRSGFHENRYERLFLLPAREAGIEALPQDRLSGIPGNAHAGKDMALCEGGITDLADTWDLGELAAISQQLTSFPGRNLTVLTAFDAPQIPARRKPLRSLQVRHDKLEARS